MTTTFHFLCATSQVLRPAAIQPALANVPSYLIPELPAAPDLTPAAFDESNVGGKRRFGGDDEEVRIQ